MRLLQRCNVGYLKFTKDLQENIPPYAILSHTWGDAEDEISFSDIETHNQNSPDEEGVPLYRSKPGYKKLDFCLNQALKDDLHYVWVDTCCIDQRDHNGVARAINSMYKWYRNSAKCYVFLPEEVSPGKRGVDGILVTEPASRLRHSRWITRGWTLQELIAPAHVEFFTKDAQSIGTKDSLAVVISEITGINIAALRGASLKNFSVNEKFHWASLRKTKYPEDKAYCLLGLFDVAMPLVPGESEKQAMYRLQETVANSFKLELQDEVKTVTPMLKESGHKKRQPGSDLNDEGDSEEDLCEIMLESLRYENMDTRRGAISAPFSSTCAWVVEHSMYKEWVQNEDTEEREYFLWLKGKPGTGKSTIMKHLDLHASSRNPRYDHQISFYFNARGDRLQKSVVGMYRSLLWQILKGSVDLQKSLLQTMDMSVSNKFNSEYWTVEILKTTFSQVLKKISDKRIICFVDALDECDEDEVRDMVEFWSELVQESRHSGSLGHIWICFASRHYPAIYVDTNLQLILENEKQHQADIELYVSKYLKTGSGIESDEIQKELVRKANGIFMWAVLVVRILNSVLRAGRIYNVQKTLNDLPPELDALFRDIITRDGGKDMEIFRICVQWMLFAARPLQPDEFYWALALSLNESVDEWTVSSLLNAETITRHVSSCSMGLAEVVGGVRPVVQFIHESVRDFLLKGNGLKELWPANEDIETIECLGHDMIKSACSRCLHMDLPEVEDLEEKMLRWHPGAKDVLDEKIPLLTYSRENFYSHAEQAAAKIQQNSFILEVNPRPLVRINNIYEHVDAIRFDAPEPFHLSDCAPLISLLAVHRAPRLIRIAFDAGLPTDNPAAPYEALYFALAMGSVATAHVLIEKYDLKTETDVIEHLPNQRGQLRMRNKQRRNPLLWALGYSYEALAFALASSDRFTASMAPRDIWDALRVAAECGSYRVVKSLSDCFSTSVKPRLLIYATTRQNAEAVRALRDHGVDLNAMDDYSSTALIIAASHHCLPVVQVLLEGGADVNVKDIDNRTALMAASSEKNPAYFKTNSDHESHRDSRTEILKLLNAAGANDELDTEDGRVSYDSSAGSGNHLKKRTLAQPYGRSISRTIVDGIVQARQLFNW